MADFDITRAQGLATVNGMLRGLVYLTILAAWKDESGAWLCIGVTPAHPDHYSVHWRSADHYGCGNLEFVGAFQSPDDGIAWAQALSIAEIAFKTGPSRAIRDKALETAQKIRDFKSVAGTKGGKKSGETRAQIAEDLKQAKELGKKYRLLILPEYDPRVWIFNPIWDTRNNPVMNFTWKKQQQTYAYIGVAKEGPGWELGRGWFPQMNDNNARIEEICFTNIGETTGRDDPAFQTLERLLKTDPEKWLREDYIRFAP